MTAEKRPRKPANDQTRRCAPRRPRRPGPRRSLNMSVCADVLTRFRLLLVLLDREPAELFMDLVDEKAARLKTSLAGMLASTSAVPEDGRGGDTPGVGKDEHPEEAGPLPFRQVG